jgi:hypothetical protein
MRRRCMWLNCGQLHHTIVNHKSKDLIPMNLLAGMKTVDEINLPFLCSFNQPQELALLRRGVSYRQSLR